MLGSRRPFMTAVLAGVLALGATACDDDDVDVEEEETTVVPPAETGATQTDAPTATEPDATTTEESTE